MARGGGVGRADLAVSPATLATEVLCIRLARIACTPSSWCSPFSTNGEKMAERE